MTHFAVVVVLSLVMWGLSMAENNHHLLLFSEITTASSEAPGATTEEDWSNIDHRSHKDVDNSEVSLESISVKGSLRMVKHFFLWTRKNAGNSSYEILDPTKLITIINSNFSARQTFIIIHGFLGWGNEAWILQLKDKLLNMSDCNVISVDWPAGSEWILLTYYTAVKDVPYVAQDTTLLLENLVTQKALNLKYVHFIGHSLGAHVSGLAGKPFKGEIGRITGLDPAGLEYHQVPAKERIDSSDAKYVDIMHTNGCYNFWNPWGVCILLMETIRDNKEKIRSSAQAATPPTPLQLTTKDMSKAFALIQEGLQIFADNDPNCERNIKIARAVNNALSSYTELYKEKDCYGINENIGHSDFWPNGGEHQPACQKVNGEIGCDHELAYKYYIESLDYGIDSTLFLARNCSHWKEYEAGNCSCGDDAQYMGYFVNTRLDGIFYLTTKSSEPFAKKDAVCLPGSAYSDRIKRLFKIVAASFSGVAAIIGVAAVGITMQRRRSRLLKSGLLTDEDEQVEKDNDDELVEA
ncbi:Inactive pancreatic lipase-related protein 1-like [Homarus americanus]|uniref:Inactive pancreatic lipase-related protein 1-like n=1 Tax=Homarus americanus TaxID=6706 RepID=A0A8J5MMR8_HOMAM|nr:Inactive pancreatic lipase-related protein 1-like [Homarus americanus]